MLPDELLKEFENSLSTVIIVSPDTCDKARVAIYKPMDNYLVPD